jgi:hypothetical protein
MVAAIKSFSDAKDCDENPFMALVDAATSILDKHRLPADSLVVAIETAEDLPKDDMASSKSKNSSPTVDPLKKSSFAEILMNVLDDESYVHILTWMPDGKAFTIVNPKKFSMDAMPKLFNIRNMSSFVRKLGRWGFQRVHERETKNSDIFKHPCFQKDRPDLCAKIKCVGRLTRSPTQGAVPAAPEDVQKVETLRLQQQIKSGPPMNSNVRSPQAAMFLEEARRLSEFSNLRFKNNQAASFSSRPPQPHALHNLTSQVVSAALETLRRDDKSLRMPISAPAPLTKASESAILKSLTAKYHAAAAPHDSSFYSAGPRGPTLAMEGGPLSLQLSYGNRFGAPAPSFAFLR